MAREALSNATRHAHAERTRLVLRSDGDWLDLRVEDDGVGFDPSAVPPAGHLGLANLRQRAEALGGELTIDSAPGAGTRLNIRVPLATQERLE